MPQYLLLFHSPDFQKWKGIVTEKYMLEAARTQAAVVNSSDSEYFTYPSTSSKLLPTEERGKTDAKVELSSGRR